MHELTIIGGGLAGCEAAWQAAQHGLKVTLVEMKPERFSPAHEMDGLAELVCSNSLRGSGMNNAVGCLKEELRRANTLFMQAADATAVPAGGALAVDRQAFSDFVSNKIASHPNIELVRHEAVQIPPSGTVIIASGPLTSATLAQHIAEATDADDLYFYDAIAPIISADTINMNIAWRASRYDKGNADYLNCPMDEAQYKQFVAQLCSADKVEAHNFEKMIHFEGCMPIEEMAIRGEQTLAFGPMKPVGLKDPRTGKIPHAVIQLRQDNRHASSYNIVGFQTKLTYAEQKRIFRTIPGLEHAEFERLGSVHRNTYINAPRCLNEQLQLIAQPRIYFAGQITGVEGYVESAACGFMAGLFASYQLLGQPLIAPPPTTACGALLHHLSNPPASGTSFQPQNVNYGLFPPLEGNKMKRALRRLAMAERALESFDDWLPSISIETIEINKNIENIEPSETIHD